MDGWIYRRQTFSKGCRVREHLASGPSLGMFAIAAQIKRDSRSLRVASVAQAGLIEVSCRINEAKPKRGVLRATQFDGDVLLEGKPVGAITLLPARIGEPVVELRNSAGEIAHSVRFEKTHPTKVLIVGYSEAGNWLISQEDELPPALESPVMPGTLTSKIMELVFGNKFHPVARVVRATDLSKLSTENAALYLTIISLLDIWIVPSYESATAWS